MSGPVGSRLEGVVGPVAHGGHCVLRQEDGPVVFVRHTLPGERVVVEITEGAEGDRFWRGDAVEVLEASPDRVEAPCRFSGPGLCGGCDLQHVRLPAQRALKAGVVREQMVRLAGLEVDRSDLHGASGTDDAEVDEVFHDALLVQGVGSFPRPDINVVTLEH